MFNIWLPAAQDISTELINCLHIWCLKSLLGNYKLWCPRGGWESNIYSENAVSKRSGDQWNVLHWALCWVFLSIVVISSLIITLVMSTPHLFSSDGLGVSDQDQGAIHDLDIYSVSQRSNQFPIGQQLICLAAEHNVCSVMMSKRIYHI